MLEHPKHISGTWQFSGDWLGHYKLVATDQDLGNPLAEYRDITCPMCEYPEAIHLTVKHPIHPLMYWCPACESVWAWYVSRCPDCWKGSFWKKGCKEGMVVCTMCRLEMDTEMAQELNEQEVWNDEV